MGSLFSKIFLSFWVAALLLGAALFGAERFLGADAVEVAGHQLDAYAETAATLLTSEGLPAVERWLGERNAHMPLVLLGSNYLPLPNQNIPPHLRTHLAKGLAPGMHPLHPRMFAVVRPIPNSHPATYLAAIVRIHHDALLPPALLFVVAIGVSGVVCLVLAMLLTQPVRRLRKATQALATGDLTVRVGGRGHDEVAALGRDFDTMTDRVRDLLERQQRLLRDVSHELRSPLARLRVALDLAQRKDDPGPPALARIAQEADRLESLVCSVLTLARLEEGLNHYQSQAVSLAELLQGIAQDALFEAETKGKGVTLLVEKDATVTGDPTLLRAAIENVVRNGVRHTAVGTSVEISLALEEAAPMALVAILDRGPGVPEEELTRLFQPFTRVGEARDRNSGGYGLGLAISHRAVEAHGGSIVVANARGGGLRVVLRLPVLVEAP